MRVAANRDVCIGAGLCVMNAPAVFDQDDDGIVVVLTQEVPAEHVAAANLAIDRCPSGALRRVDDAANRSPGRGHGQPDGPAAGAA